MRSGTAVCRRNSTVVLLNRTICNHRPGDRSTDRARVVLGAVAPPGSVLKLRPRSASPPRVGIDGRTTLPSDSLIDDDVGRNVRLAKSVARTGAVAVKDLDQCVRSHRRQWRTSRPPLRSEIAKPEPPPTAVEIHERARIPVAIFGAPRRWRTHVDALLPLRIVTRDPAPVGHQTAMTNWSSRSP